MQTENCIKKYLTQSHQSPKMAEKQVKNELLMLRKLLRKRDDSAIVNQHVVG